MKQTELLNKAIKLRQQGYSFREIGERFNISKSTASLWLRDIKMSTKGKTRLQKMCDDSREKGAAICRQNRQKRWQAVADKTMFFRNNLENYSINQCKVMLAMMYWGEGAKTGRRVGFMNSDPLFVKSYLFLLRKTFAINENRLRARIHLHTYHNREEMIDYWSKVTKIEEKYFAIYQKKNTGIATKEGYRGCISIVYSDAKIYDEIALIIDRFQKAIK
jgi:hypothetical protein